ncbi:multidrug efflux SMR transporter [Ideonella sp. B7]|uniref:DMT family transporter n=1 Tax=Ideonella benzenivorans TaxID=2831643 RepID=UPI001CED3AA7|nr:multidrug efflux SMR transporter [Ideonella benzenivorans]MCA6215999.1 multidrug efflux SMR transporter [Ideonella benzenivorans]
MFDVTQPKLAWTLILVSGLLEVAFSTSVQLSHGFTRLLPASAALLFGGLSVYLMSLTLQVIPIGTAYAVWGGIGAVGTVLVGLLAFGETLSLLRIGCIALIVLGIVGLQWAE